MPESSDADRYRLRPSNQGHAADRRDQRKEHGSYRIDVHDRVEGHATEEPGGRIPESIRRPGMRGLMNRQREQQDDEGDEDLREVDVQEFTFQSSDFRLQIDSWIS